MAAEELITVLLIKLGTRRETSRRSKTTSHRQYIGEEVCNRGANLRGEAVNTRLPHTSKKELKTKYDEYYSVCCPARPDTFRGGKRGCSQFHGTLAFALQFAL